ncbi:hypothetical protein AAY473_003758 [Plecturocebus cupreus]
MLLSCFEYFAGDILIFSINIKRCSKRFGRLRWADHLRTGVQKQPEHIETVSVLKIQKISWPWWHMPVIPATWEAEAGESLEPGS